jgi:hypothetical protein
LFVKSFASKKKCGPESFGVLECGTPTVHSHTLAHGSDVATSAPGSRRCTFVLQLRTHQLGPCAFPLPLSQYPLIPDAKRSLKAKRASTVQLLSVELASCLELHQQSQSSNRDHGITWDILSRRRLLFHKLHGLLPKFTATQDQ